MNFDSNYSEYIHKVTENIRTTIGSRFNASRRLNNKYKFSAISISILSIFGIGTPIIQNFIDSNKCLKINELYTLVSILLSIFILVLSLLEGSQNYQVKAEKLHSNAVDISTVSKEIYFLTNYELKIATSETDKKKIITEIKQQYKEYDDLIKRCPENHDPDDYLLFKAQNYKEFKKEWLWSKRILIWLRIKYYWLYFVLTTTIAIIIIKLYLSCPV